MAKVILAANTDWYLYNFRLSLARSLRERGHEVVLVSPPGRFAGFLEKYGFRWIEWDLGRKTLAPWKELRSLLSLWKIYRQERPALVHHHTIKPVLYGSIAARLAGIPVYVNSVTGRGYVFLGDDTKARLISRLVKPFYRWVTGYNRCGMVFENAGDMQYFLEQKLARPERSWLIEGVGVDPVVFAPLPEPSGGPVILMAARMLWDKGVGELVEAARAVKDIKARVVLVGEPDPGNPKSVNRDDLLAWNNEGVIEWWGWQDDMVEAYRSCNIVALPSYYEGVPTALLEAAACARPIVATDIPGCRAVVKDGVNGFLVPVGDSLALADALRKLVVDSDLRKRMGAAGRQIVVEHYTDDQINEKTLEVYSLLAIDFKRQAAGESARGEVAEGELVQRAASESVQAVAVKGQADER